MKALAKSVLTSFLTGLAFMAGVFLAIILLEDPDRFKTERPTSWVNFPDDLIIADAEIVPDQDDFTIQGIVTNTGSLHWEDVYMDLAVLAGEAQLNSCDETVTEVRPNSTRQFKIDCYDTAGRNLPSNVSFSIEIRAARHYLAP